MNNMTLGTLRTLAAANISRPDMADGAEGYPIDWYIRAACDYLDNNYDVFHMNTWCMKQVAAGTKLIPVEDLLSIDRVYGQNSADGRWAIEPKVDSALLIPTAEVSLDVSGCAQSMYYTETRSRLHPGQEDLTTADYGNEFDYGVDDLLLSDQEGFGHEFTTILLYPTTTEAFTLQVLGKFRSKKLVEAADFNFWTEVHSDILIAATCLTIELLMYRNTEGARDWENYIIRGKNALKRTETRKQIALATRMKG